MAGYAHGVQLARTKRIRKIQSIFCDVSELPYGETCMGGDMIGYFLRKGKYGRVVVSYRQVYVKMP